MKDKYIIHFTKKSEREWEFSLRCAAEKVIGYLKKIFWYTGSLVKKRRRSYASMFVISLVMLSFVFTNLIFNESRIDHSLSRNFGGMHHVFFLGVDGAQAKGAAEHEGVKDSLIIPVIATLESSVDSSTVGKVAVLTREIMDFYRITLIHGQWPDENGILVSDAVYAKHDYLTLGEERDLYFDSDTMVCRYMVPQGIYTCTDSESTYIFVTEETGERIKAETGHRVTFDTYLTLDIASDRNAAKIAGEIIRRYGIPDSELQRTDPESTTERSRYREYINVGASSYRYRSGMDINRFASMGATLTAALIMTSFARDLTERYMYEYGILSAYGAKKRHLLG
ncbi:MAG: hypothetical protein E7638_08705, partial [Ruminococcaceae bacterium]|nr:hypothetical protein [Oscillospiraceae bacterium]